MATQNILLDCNIDSLPVQQIVAASWASNSITFTVLNHGYGTGVSVTVTGMTPAGYNGTYSVNSGATTNTFTVPQAVNPGAATVFGTVQATWVNGENFTIGDGATLTINASSGSKRMGMNNAANQNVLTINNGRLLISNSSTTTPIRVTWAQIAAAASSRVINIASGLGLIEIQGNYIELGTGDGTDSQVMTLPYTDYMPCVMVETGNGTGVFEPWPNIGHIPMFNSQLGIWRGLQWVPDDIRGKGFVQGTASVSAIAQSGINATELFTNQITFGGSGRGRKVPTGARVRVPNIVLTDESNRTTYTSTTFSTNGNITMAGGGRFIANWCNFGYVQLDATGAQQLELRNCAFTQAPLIVRCSPIIDTVGIGRGLAYPSYAGGWLPTDIGNYSRTWQQVSNASITRLVYAVDGEQAEGINTTGLSMLIIAYSDNVTLTDCTFWTSRRRRADIRALTLSNCTNVVGNGCNFLGGPLHLVTSSGCTFNGSKWANTIEDHGTVTAASTGITHDPNTKQRLVNGQRYYLKIIHRRGIVVNPSYNADADGYWETPRVYSVTPYDGGVNHPDIFGATPGPASVLLKWLRQDPNPSQTFTIATGALTSVSTTATMALPSGHGFVTGDEITVAGATPSAYNGTYTLTGHTATSISYTFAGGTSPATGTITVRLRVCYQIYRSTSWGTLGSLLTSVYSVGSTAINGTEAPLEIYNDTTAVNGTTYFYTLRKFDGPGVYTDSAQQEATPDADAAQVTNLLLQSSALDTAAWTKTNVTVTTNSIRSPLVNAWTNAGADADTLTPTGDGSVTQAVAASAGTTYTFSVFMRALTPTTANPEVTLQLQISDNGSSPQTTTQVVTASFGLKRVWVTHTASAGTTQITCRIGGGGTFTATNPIAVGITQLVVGSSPGPIIGPTTTTSLSALPSYFNIDAATGVLAAVGNSAVTRYGGQEIFIRQGTLGANAGVVNHIDVHVGTTSSFTPSPSNLAWSTFANANSAENSNYALKLSASSNDNVFNGFEQVGQEGFSGGTAGLLTIDASSRNRFIGFRFNINGGGAITDNKAITYSTATSFNNFIHDWEVNGFSRALRLINIAAALVGATNVVTGLTIQNMRSDSGYLRPHLWSVNGTIVKGCFGARTYMGRLQSGDVILDPDPMQSTELTLTAVFDTMFVESYDSDTTGALTLHMTSATAAAGYSIISGTPKFDNGGGLLLGTAGDSIEFEWPHMIYGVSGFRTLDLGRAAGDSCLLGSAVAAGAMGDPTNNYGLKYLSTIKLEYAINTGSGYGALKRLTNANLTAETVSASTGFRIKIRMTAMRSIPYVTRSTTFVQGETINGQTSGATAVIDEIFETPPFRDARGSTAGLLWVSSVTGTWAASENIRSGVTARAVTSATAAYVILPIKNQAANNTIVRGLRIFTNVDQTVKYSASINTITISGVVSGSRLVIRNTNTNSVLVNAVVTGTSYAYVYDSTSPFPVEIILRKASSAPYYKQWRATATLSDADQAITAIQELDQ